jgi:phage FluMu protein Com
MKCPRCKQVITSLCSEATATTGISMDLNGKIIFDNEDLNKIAEINEWRCPKCDEILAWNEEEAKNFIKKD